MNLITKLNETNSNAQKQESLIGIPFLEWQTFVYAYNNYMVFHMKFDDYDMDNLGEPTDLLFKLLNDILEGTYSGNAAKMRVQTFAAEQGDLIKLIINHDLRCGVTATTFNKVHPESIAQFKAQKAKEIPLTDLTYPILAQLKYDGVRLIAINDEGSVTFRTYNGKFVNLPDLKVLLEDIPIVNYILDGEIVLDNGKQEDRPKVSGMINSAMHGGTINEMQMVFYVFDTMSKREWDANECVRQYSSRYAHLNSIVEKIEDFHVQIAPTNEIHNAEAALTLYEGALQLGYEGLVLKHAEHYYTFKRSKDWIKVKEVKTVDLKCVGIQDGEGKYEGMIGALYCAGYIDGKRIKVKVGSGLSDIQRGLPKPIYINEIIEIKYNAIIQDSVTKEWSLFLPRFVQVRFDK